MYMMYGLGIEIVGEIQTRNIQLQTDHPLYHQSGIFRPGLG